MMNDPNAMTLCIIDHIHSTIKTTMMGWGARSYRRLRC